MGRTDKNNNNAKASSAPRRRAGTSIDDFAHRKGVTKAIQDFRKRKEKKRTETAKALRQYKKTMKQEGYEPGRGASRKRVEKQEQDHDHNNNNGNKKVQKSNPFAKSLQKAENHKKQKDQAAAEKEAQEKEREKKMKERRIRSKKLRQRTSKGQPVMKHVIHDILRKLEREKEDEKEE